MNCITVMEPYASALIFGLKTSELRNFRIPEGECLIHVSMHKIGYPVKKLHEFYRSIGANFTADCCLVRYNGETETEHIRLGENKLEVIKKIDENSADWKLSDSLFRRNHRAQDGAPFLHGQIIGSVEFTGHSKSNDKNYKFENHCNNGQLFTLKNSIFSKGRTGLYQVQYNHSTRGTDEKSKSYQ